MHSEDRSKKLRLYISIAIAFLFGLAFVSVVPAIKQSTAFASQPVFSSGVQDTNVPNVRNVIVDYMYESEPGGASGNKSLAVDSIQFYPGYVVITDTNETSRLFAVDRLRRFNYRPADSK